MRVEFANGQAEAEFQVMEDVNFTDSELVYHIRGALSSVSLGDTDSYNQLVSVMHHKDRLAPDEVALLVTSLKALSGAVSYIDIDLHKSLLAAIFNMSLWDYGADVMDALIELIISLAVSSGKYMESCLDMLVFNFMPPHYFMDTLKQPRGLIRKDQVLSRVHLALKHIADLVPLAPLRLEQIIVQKMQSIFVKGSLATKIIYVENMLRLEKGEMREFVGRKILTALVDKLLDLDVEIGWDEILQDDFSKGIFELELDVDESIDDVDEDSSELPGELSRYSLSGNVFAETLDSLIVLTFEHLESCDDGRLNEVFDILLRSFQRTVLTAHKSKFAQFVMFYGCALNPEFCGVKFAITLEDMFVSCSDPPLTRMSAVAYLASYLSRGKFLSTSLVTTILERLVDWCLEYCKSKTQDGDLNPKAHQVFYSGCQAIMYVLCFRMRSIIEVPRLKSQLMLMRMPLGSILTHKLCPLKVCLPSIVEEFLRQAEVTHLFTPSETFIFHGLLESEYSKAFGGMERLDMFFPFDPCLLKRCDRYIRPHFVYWSMVRSTYDDNEEGSSEEDVAEIFPAGMEENVMDDEAIPRSYDDQDFDLDEFDLALNKMSITPKNSLKHGFGIGLRDYVQMPSRIRPSTSPESL